MERGNNVKKQKINELEILFLAYAEPLYYYLLKISGSHFIAEELVQETFYRAALSLDLYENEQVKSWIYKVARNAYMDEWRKRQRWKWVPFLEQITGLNDLPSPYGVPEEEVMAKQRKEEVEDIMKLLPEQYRSILYLREQQQFSYEELSETLELSAEQVKVTLHRARKRFKQLAERLGKNF